LALGNDLLMGALIIGGGYIFIYHVLPGLQTAGASAGGFPGSQAFSDLSRTGQTRCWEIGNGKRACSCQGQQYFVMGETRTCEDCTTHCAGGTPPVRSPTATTPAATGTGTGHRCWIVNPTNGQKACACAGKQNFIMGVARTCSDCQAHCTTGAAPDLKRPTSNPTPPKQTNTSGAGTWECKVTATGTTGRRWVCINRATRQSVIQAPGWLCTGKAASSFPVGYPCTIAR
jgi:hypothetical protein